MSDWQPIRFDVTVPDGTVTVRDWPRRVAFSSRFLREAAPRYVQRDGMRVVLTVANGSATYELEREPGGPEDDLLERVSISATLVEEKSSAR